MQKPIEIILARQLAETLAVPAFLVDADGNLLFYNAPAEQVLGVRFEETGELPLAQWTTAFGPTDTEGRALPAESMPLVIALRQGRPAHADFRVRGLDQVERHIHVTAFPIVGCEGRVKGAVAFFWQDQSPP